MVVQQILLIQQDRADKAAGDTISKLFDTLDKKLVNHSDNIRDIKELLYGNPEKGEKGMKQMVEEMHTRFVQANGIMGSMKLILLIGGVIGMLYTFFKKF